jgi:nicotinate-nucleotide adenylyltransferase
MRIGIFGGSFDPVHFGHLLLAEVCREQCSLDEVWFLPAASPPHKRYRALSAAGHRVAMLELAIAGHDAFRVSSLEIERGGVSYTVQTLRELKHQQPDNDLFFLMGADSLRDLPMWREPAEICRLAIPVVVRRRSAPEPDLDVLCQVVDGDRLEAIRNCQAEMPLVDFSSTEIRQAIAHRHSVRYQTPRAVEKYIETNNLYCHQDIE